MPQTIPKRALHRLPPELEQEFLRFHASELDRLLPIVAPAFGCFVMAFAVWNLLMYGADWQHVFLIGAASAALAAIAFHRAALRWPVTQRAGYLYWVYGGALILLGFVSDKGAQYGMTAIAAAAFLIALFAVRISTFFWIASGPLLLFMALAGSDAAAGDYGGNLVSYLLALVLALLMMGMFRYLWQKAFLLELQFLQHAPRDSATGLFSRDSITELAAREFMRARRLERPFAVAMIDIDRFKQINDTFGEQTGEAVIQAFAGACRAHLREIDLLGRVGGDEFACVLPETAESDALACAERLRERIEGITIDAPRGPVRLTASIGIAVLAAEHVSWESMIRAADAALYQAKCEGRNRVVAAWTRRDGLEHGKGGAVA